MKRLTKTLVILFAIASLIALLATSRRGYILPELGIVLNFVYSPSDMWQEIFRVETKPGKNEYMIEFSHTYPGSYDIRLPAVMSETEIMIDQSFSATIEIARNGKILFKEENITPFQFLDKDHFGLGIRTHRFPQDISERNDLTMKVDFVGDFDHFIEKYKNNYIYLSKGSDE